MSMFAGAGGLLTGFVGAVIEAWAQLRIGKLRVLLSLVGVAAAVAAMSFVIAVGQVSVSAINSEIEQGVGRPGTVTINVSPTGKDVTVRGQDDPGDDDAGASSAPTAGSGQSGSGQGSGQSGSGQSGSGQGSAGSGRGGAGSSGATASAATSDRVNRAMASFVSRYEASSWATTYTTKVRFAFPDGPRQISTQAVSEGYGTLHHTSVSQGRWFRSDDADDLSPTLVVSQGFLEDLGISELTEPVTVTSYTPVRTTFTIVGVLEPENLSYCTTTDAEGNNIPCPQPLSAFVLADSYEQQLPEESERPIPTLEIWAGKAEAQQVKDLAKASLDAQFGQGSTQTTDNVSGSSNVSADAFTTVVTGSGVFVMILGALSLVNISLVTVRQCIHEIGVRRSFGATSRRIFFSIMLESVVATVVAGVVGVGIAIVALRWVPLSVVFDGLPMPSNPPFPMLAAVIGLLAATAVGALSGIIPAIVAVRIRPIDAIRY